MASPARAPYNRSGWYKTADGWAHRDPRIQEILTWYRLGRPVKEIAFQFGISLPRVSRIARRAGLPSRKASI